MRRPLTAPRPRRSYSICRADVLRRRCAELFHVHRQSCYLFGRDRIVRRPPSSSLVEAALLTSSSLQVADIPVDHPSASKQHAVLQFRQVTERNEFGDTKSLTKCALSLSLSTTTSPR